MSDSARNSDAILAAARASLNDNRAGGRRVSGQPIGQRSAAMRRAAQKRKAAAVALGVLVGVMLIKLVLSLVMGALHVIGAVAIAGFVVAAVVAMLALLRNPGVVIPSLDKLRGAPAKMLVGQTQVWLEAQRPALPAPAINLVGQIGGQLDLLGNQLDRLDESTPAVAQVRTLVGQHLPDLVNAYTAIPEPLRKEKQGDASPDDKLVASLGKISTEIDSVTRQLAEGSIDQLSIQTRFLDYKYGDTAGD